MENAAPQHSVSIHATLASKVNFACQQNAVPLVRDLAIQNDGEESLRDLTVEIVGEPGFIYPVTWPVRRLDAGGRVHLSDRDLPLKAEFLWHLTEALAATVRIRVLSGETELAGETVPVELLAWTEWGGTPHMPEMIAAFVTPNDPAVETILKQAADALRRAEREPSLEGYQANSPRRVGHMAWAIWSAICAQQLDYANPPASFEQTGQKIRTPSHVLEAGMATCLDLTTLFASCLEQAGLHPVVVFTRGHAFVGCWLQNEQFASVTVDDITSLRKRVQLGELLFFETTLAAKRPAGRFAAAIKHARMHLTGNAADRFEMAVDIRRARMQRIRPIPLARETGGEGDNATPADAPATDIPDFESLSAIPGEAWQPQTEEPETPATRLDRWQRKLLDLSLRNRLLNFRNTTRSVPIACPEPERLEDRLADGEAIRILPMPKLTSEVDGRSAEVYQNRHGENPETAYALEALERNEVLVKLTREELDRRLIELFRGARSARQEGGANTLFLAVGFLAWRKGSGVQDKPFQAPLILVPVNLERQSVRSGMRLVIHDDESLVNPTLLQMLEQDFGITVPELNGPLPVGESGLDVEGIWNAMTRAIRDMEGWEVTRDVVLSTFSFAKHLMWKDLVERTAELKQNPVVRHLIDSPKEVYHSSVPFPDTGRLDQDYPPKQTFTPLPADSSQLSAVMAAAAGKDFVLVGPPGTGKSQTIANMIAQCLAEGKTVLFVSEKAAALDVVHRRLRSIGIGEFCLDLHSSKARKLDALEQLRSAWEAKSDLDPSQWEREAARLGRLREQLNSFASHLHERFPNGLTPYKAIGQVVAGRHVPPVPLSWPAPDHHDEVTLERLQDLAERIGVNSADTGGLAEAPFAGIAVAEWSPTWQRELITAAREAMPLAEAYRRWVVELLNAIGMPDAARDRESLRALETLAVVLPDAYGENYGFALEPQGAKLIEKLQHGRDLLRQRREAVGSLSRAYKPDGLAALPVAELANVWSDAANTWWPRSFFLRRRVKKALREATTDGQLPDVMADLPHLETIQALDEQLKPLNGLSGQTAGLWQGGDTSDEALERAIRVAETVRGVVSALAGTPDAFTEVQGAIRRLLVEGNPMLAPEAAVGRAVASLMEARRALNERLASLCVHVASPLHELIDPNAEDWSQALRDKLAGWIKQENRLRSWCAWQRVRDEAMAHGLAPLVEAVERGAVSSDNVREAFEVNYCRWWLAAVVDRDDVLRNFVPVEHERAIEEFRKLDEQFTELTCAYIRAKLCGQLPDTEEASRAGDWGVLKRELEKKRRHKPLRQLVEEIPDALTTLAPCLLMSPLSIAQYLSPHQAQFDVVIFDEASQIPVWDAVGAIARGKQTVIVGDPKQLPPTTFFERADEDDEEDEDIERDLESILDECMGASLPVRHLNWHYRSRHESLIAFSNHRYYDGGLITFPAPAPVTEDNAVSFHHVSDGVYEKGGARINQAEAKALVADIVARLNDPEFAAEAPSIGIVTFNTEQQKLIEDLLDEERRNDPGLEPWFSDDALEPVMVKNLESVQGDERDIIYFSVTYGPDRAGRVSVNFGPLNRDGGERRLNVAITRARQEMRVFAALRAEQIDLSRTQAIGVRDFKHVLEYAERGPKALAEAVHPTMGDFDSPFEQAVAAALADKGWQLHPQVGVSSFRIDLAVVHPDAPGRYLAGVECDGATYHRSATARDRDKIRESVLRGLGWEILRVWSIDWWTDAPGCLEQLDAQLTKLLAASRAETPEPVAKAQE